MRKAAVLALALALPALTSAQTFQHVPDPYKGTFVFENKGFCTGFAVRREGRRVYGYTAHHCLHGAKPGGDTIFWATDPAKGDHYGRIRFHCAENDVAEVSFETDRPVELLETTTGIPLRGTVIWAVGVAGNWSIVQPWVPLVTWGVWIGTEMRWVNEGVVMITYQSSLPISKGMSGGPVSYEGKVFGMTTVGHDPTPSSPWSGIALLSSLKLGCP